MRGRLWPLFLALLLAAFCGLGLTGAGIAFLIMTGGDDESAYAARHASTLSELREGRMAPSPLSSYPATLHAVSNGAELTVELCPELQKMAEASPVRDEFEAHALREDVLQAAERCRENIRARDPIQVGDLMSLSVPLSDVGTYDFDDQTLPLFLMDEPGAQDSDNPLVAASVINDGFGVVVREPGGWPMVRLRDFCACWPAGWRSHDIPAGSFVGQFHSWQWYSLELPTPESSGSATKQTLSSERWWVEFAFFVLAAEEQPGGPGGLPLGAQQTHIFGDAVAWRLASKRSTHVPWTKATWCD